LFDGFRGLGGFASFVFVADVAVDRLIAILHVGQ